MINLHVLKVHTSHCRYKIIANHALMVSIVLPKLWKSQLSAPLVSIAVQQLTVFMKVL